MVMKMANTLLVKFVTITKFEKLAKFGKLAKFEKLAKFKKLDKNKKRYLNDFLTKEKISFEKSPESKIDYSFNYTSLSEFTLLALLFSIAAAAAIWLLYRFFPILILSFPIGCFFSINSFKNKAEKRRKDLTLDFADFLISFGDSLKIGMSPEKAFDNVVFDWNKDNSKKHKDLFKELKQIQNGYKTGRSLGSGLESFSRRSNVTEIRTFGEIYNIAFRKGDKPWELAYKTASLIKERNKIHSEIEVILSEKRMEKRIIDIIPFFIIYMLSTTSPEFIKPIYTTLVGRVAMTFSLFLFALAWFLSSKIMRVKV